MADGTRSFRELFQQGSLAAATSPKSASPAHRLWRTLRQVVIEMTWRQKAVALGGFSLAGLAFGGLGADAPLMGLLIGACAALLLNVVAHAPDAILIIAVTVVYAPFLITLAPGYASLSLWANGGDPGGVDPVYATFWMTLAYLVAVWVSVKWSRGRRWITVLLVAVASVAPWFVMTAGILPSLGLLVPYLAMAIVLLLRCGGVTAIVIGAERVVEGFRSVGTKGSSEESDLFDLLEGWVDVSSVEKQTTLLLAELDSDTNTQFHEIGFTGTLTMLPHLVIGASGVFLIGSIHSAGPLSEVKGAGVTLPDCDLAEITATLLEHRAALSKLLNVREGQLNPVIVLHGRFTKVRHAFDAYSTEDPAPLGRLTLVSADLLLDEVSPGIVVLGGRRRRQMARRVKLRAKTAATPIPPKGYSPQTPILSIVSPNGESKSPVVTGGASSAVDSGSSANSWMRPGTPCHVLTSQGPVENLRLMSRPILQGEFWSVALCHQAEWEVAQSSGEVVKEILFPVFAVQEGAVASHSKSS